MTRDLPRGGCECCLSIIEALTRLALQIFFVKDARQPILKLKHLGDVPERCVVIPQLEGKNCNAAWKVPVVVKSTFFNRPYCFTGRPRPGGTSFSTRSMVPSPWPAPSSFEIPALTGSSLQARPGWLLLELLCHRQSSLSATRSSYPRLAPILTLPTFATYSVSLICVIAMLAWMYYSFCWFEFSLSNCGLWYADWGALCPGPSWHLSSMGQKKVVVKSIFVFFKIFELYYKIMLEFTKKNLSTYFFTNGIYKKTIFTYIQIKKNIWLYWMWSASFCYVIYRVRIQ